MNEKPIRFGIVGTGMIADFHAKALHAAKGAELGTVFNRTYKKARTFADAHGAVAVSTLDELLDSNIDAVCITTPSGMHADPALAAIAAGKHVLCEKPLEITLERTDSIISAAELAGVTLATVFQARFSNGAQTLKRAVEERRFGRLTLSSCYFKWWRDQSYYDSGGWRGTWKLDGGGAFMNQGIHAVDLLLWLVGMPSEVAAFAGTLAHERIEVEDTAVAALKFPSGALGVIEGATSTHPGFARRVEISGDKGTAILEDDTIKVWQFAEERPEDKVIQKAAASPGIMNGGASNPKAINLEGHRRQIEDLVQAIREKRPPAVSGKEARNAVQLILSIYEAARKGETIKLQLA